jgi:hypothetical protein
VYQRALPHQGELSLAGHTDSHLSWRPPAIGVLSEMDGRALCYPAFPLVVLVRKSYKDGVNRRSRCCLSLQPRATIR